MSRRIIVMTGDPIGPKLAGPAIRAWNICRVLSAGHEVRLISLGSVQSFPSPFPIHHVYPGDDRGLAPHLAWADIVVFQGHSLAMFDSLASSDKILVADVYDPMHLEQLEQARLEPQATWEKRVSDETQALNDQLARCDFFMCASERQRLFYLGQLAAVGRVNPRVYRDDPELRGLIDVVPFGLSAEPPVHERAALRGIVPGIGVEDKLVLWSGGVYDWFDPETLIRAVAYLHERHDNVRLYFQGTKHPNPGVPEMAVVARSRQLARSLGVLDRAVFFNDSWVDYADRQNYLTEADAGVSTHFEHLETTFSFRTRILDYLWAGLPMVVTRGDHFGAEVVEFGMGFAVAERDVVALAAALETVLYDSEMSDLCRRAVEARREHYEWDAVLSPLVTFVEDAHRARDSDLVASSRRRTRRRTGPVHDARLLLHYVRNGGLRLVIRKVGGRVRRITGSGR